MSVIAKCRNCGQPVTIPSGLAFDATVCCPICHSEFPLHAILATASEAPPALVTVAPPQASAAAPPLASPAEAPQLGPAPLTIEATSSPASLASPPPGAAITPMADEGASIAFEPPIDVAPMASPEAEAEPAPMAIESSEPAMGESPMALPPMTQDASIEVPFSLALLAETPTSEAVAIADAPVTETPVVAEAAPTAEAAEAATEPKPQSTDTEFAVGSLDIGHGDDGQPVSGELLDLWKEAGIAPPMETHEATAEETPDGDEHPADAPSMDFAEKKLDDQGRPVRNSLAAQWTEREKKDAKSLAPRVIGMIVAGFLGLGVAFLLFTAIQCAFTPSRHKSPNTATPAKSAEKTKSVQPSGIDWKDPRKK
jgi:hypothetical protein